MIIIYFSLDFQLLSTVVLITVNALCLIWQLWWIIPYTPLWKKEVQTCVDTNPRKNISILTSNVLTPNRNVDALIDLFRKHEPDLLITLESDKWWEQQLEVIENEMPFTVKCPLDNLYGIHLYSRLKLHDCEISFLVEKEVPSIHASVELRTGEKIRVHFLHPAPPSPTENVESKERDAELIVVARSISKSDQPVIVTGDLNDVAWSSTTRLFRKISGLLDPRIGRGMYNTFHANYVLLRWPLDHLFHSKHFTLRSIQRLPAIGSDHFPLLTLLAFTPENGHQQEGIKADAEDLSRAKEITDEQNVHVDHVPQPSEQR